MKDLPYPPPWMDLATLCAHLCIGATTADSWVAKGVLPPARKRGGKLMWKWSEVDEKLTLGEVAGTPDSQAERIKDGTRRAAENRTGH